MRGFGGERRRGERKMGEGGDSVGGFLWVLAGRVPLGAAWLGLACELEASNEVWRPGCPLRRMKCMGLSPKARRRIH